MSTAASVPEFKSGSPIEVVGKDLTGDCAGAVMGSLAALLSLLSMLSFSFLLYVLRVLGADEDL